MNDVEMNAYIHNLSLNKKEWKPKSVDRRYHFYIINQVFT